MPEKFAFQQMFRNGRTIHVDQGPVPPGTQGMDSPGHQLFACAALAPDQDRIVGPGNGVNGLQELAYGGDWPTRFASAAFSPARCCEGEIFPDQAVTFQGLANGAQQDFFVKRFGDKVIGSPFHSLHGNFNAAVGGHHNDR